MSVVKPTVLLALGMTLLTACAGEPSKSAGTESSNGYPVTGSHLRQTSPNGSNVRVGSPDELDRVTHGGAPTIGGNAP
jgi:hypothetical protein